MLMPRQKRQPVASGRPTSLAAPIGGWNARDALANMPPNDAVYLTNWFPSTTYCVLRKGYSRFATGIIGWTETLMAYTGGTTEKLFAAAGSVIYDITAGGTASSSRTSMTNARWQYVNNTTSGGKYIQAVNGADYMQVYNGTAWFSNADGPPYAVTGFDTRTATNITVSHNRVWFTEAATLKGWYLPAGAIGGAATAFDLSSFCQRGGYLMRIDTWTMDAGYGMDDMTVFITSEGEVLVYRGTDPASSTTWGLVGVYWIGSPIGRRCSVKYAGDLLIITRDGVQPMSLALQSSRINSRVSLTDKIQEAVSTAVSLYGSNFGWQLLPYPDQNMLFLNVPLQESSIQQQYVMNTITQSWCNFNSWNAACWELYGDQPYFGSNGYVGKAWDGLSDAGGNILGNGLQAFNYFRSPGQNKQFTNMQPVFYADGTPTILTQMNIDFDLSDPTGSASFTPNSGAVWGSGLWDVGLWGAGQSISQEWQGANGIGKCAAPHVIANCQGVNLQWMSTNVLYKPGGIL